jgi:hypothetical protein
MYRALGGTNALACLCAGLIQQAVAAAQAVQWPKGMPLGERLELMRVQQAGSAGRSCP